MNRFQRLVQQRLDERGWSKNRIAVYGDLNRSTVYRLLNAATFKQMPDEATLRGFEKGLDLPYQVLKDAAAESMGIRVYDEPTSDADTQVVIATMDRLPAARRREIREMAELLAKRYLDGQE